MSKKMLQSQVAPPQKRKQFCNDGGFYQGGGKKGAYGKAV